MKIRKAWFIGVDGEVKRLLEIEGKELVLADMYKVIGCNTIEHVGLKKGVDMWVDEEGLFNQPVLVNVKASTIYRDVFKDSSLGIVGNAIITDNTKEGNFIK